MQASHWGVQTQLHSQVREYAPPAVPQVAHHVGRRLAQHKGRLDYRDVMPVGGVLLIVLALVGAGTTIPSILDGSESVASLAFVPVAIAIGAVLLWRSVRLMKQTLDICERGLIHRIGGKEQVVWWTDVTGHRAIRVLAPNGLEKGFRLVLLLADGRRLTFTTWLTNVHGLYAHVASFVPPF